MPGVSNEEVLLAAGLRHSKDAEHQPKDFEPFTDKDYVNLLTAVYMSMVAMKRGLTDYDPNDPQDFLDLMNKIQAHRKNFRCPSTLTSQ